MLYRRDAGERTGVQKAKASALRQPSFEGEPSISYKALRSLREETYNKKS